MTASRGGPGGSTLTLARVGRGFGSHIRKEVDAENVANKGFFCRRFLGARQVSGWLADFLRILRRIVPLRTQPSGGLGDRVDRSAGSCPPSRLTSSTKRVLDSPKACMRAKKDSSCSTMDWSPPRDPWTRVLSKAAAADRSTSSTHLRARSFVMTSDSGVPFAHTAAMASKKGSKSWLANRSTSPRGSSGSGSCWEELDVPGGDWSRR
jgi:hypothetical protein